MASDRDEVFLCEKLRAKLRKDICLKRQDARYQGRIGSTLKTIYDCCARGPDVAKPQCAQGGLVRLSVGDPPHTPLLMAKVNYGNEEMD